MDTKEKAGARIKALRQAAKLTLQDVSDGTKGVVSPSQLSNFEQGIRMVSVDAAKALAPVLKTLPEYLLTLIDAEPDENEVALLELYRACDDRGKEATFHAAQEQVKYSMPAPQESVEPAKKKLNFREFRAPGIMRAKGVSRSEVKKTSKEVKK